MRSITLRFLLACSVAALPLLGAACSRQARAARVSAKADAHYAAFRYDAAEIEYKNTLQLEPLNPHAIARLGMIYRTQVRTGQALTYLMKAKELLPNDVDVRINLAHALLAAGGGRVAREEALFIMEHRPADPDAPLLLVETAATPQELEATRSRLNAMPQPWTAPVLVAMAQCELRAGRTAAAENLLLRARKTDPKFANAAAGLGMICWARKDLTTADALFKEAYDLSPVRSTRRLQYAQFKLQTGDRDNARRLLEEITKAAPDYVPALLWQVEIAASEKRYPEAEAILARGLARDSANPELLMLSGRVRLAKGEVDRAIADLDRLVSLYPRLPGGAYLLGMAWTTKGDLTKAAEYLNRAVTLSPDYTMAIVALAEVNLRRGNFNAAAVPLKALIAKHPEMVPAALLLAQSYRAMGNLNEALNVYQDLEKRISDNQQIPYLRGLVLRDLGRTAQARTAFQRAATLTPDAIGPVQQLVALDIADKAYGHARQLAEGIALRLPKSAEPYLLQANIHLAAGDIPAAEAALRRGISVQPDAAAPYLMLARLYVSTRRQAEALANLRAAIAQRPKDVEALTTLATLLDMQKDPGAAEAYEKVLAVDDKSVVALNNLAYLLSVAGGPAQLERAQTLAQRARTLVPTEPRTADTLGWILYQRGDYKQAMPLLQEAAAGLPDEPEAQFHAGMVLYMLGDTAAAQSALQAALRGTLPAAAAAEARQRLTLAGLDPSALSAADRAWLEKVAGEKPADPQALMQLAVACQREGNLRRARQLAEAARDASPNNVRTWTLLARVQAAAGSRAEALESAKTAHNLAPDDPAAAHMLGKLAYDTGQYRWAASLLSEAVDRSPQDAELRFDAARAAYSVGRVDDAQAAARAALERSPDAAWAAEARRFLELVAVAANPADRTAHARVDETLKSEPDNVPALMARAVLADNAGDGKAAQAAYEKVLQLFPDFAPAQRALAIVYAANLEDAAKAATLAAKARQTYPTDPELAKAYGIIVYRQGEFSRAVTLLQSSAANRRDDSELLYYLGMTQYRLKRKAESKAALKRALELGLRPDYTTEAKRVLAASD